MWLSCEVLNITCYVKAAAVMCGGWQVAIIEEFEHQWLCVVVRAPIWFQHQQQWQVWAAGWSHQWLCVVTPWHKLVTQLWVLLFSGQRQKGVNYEDTYAKYSNIKIFTISFHITELRGYWRSNQTSISYTNYVPLPCPCPWWRPEQICLI